MLIRKTSLPLQIEWAEIPFTKIVDVSPPNPPSDFGTWYGFRNNVHNVTDAWSGGAYDSLRHRLIIWGGGHGDYAGNEIYAYDVAARTMSRIWGPTADSYFVTGEWTPGQTYDDGNPVSRHTACDLEYLPTTDKLLAKGYALYPASSGTRATWQFDFSSGIWTQVHDGVSPSIPYYGSHYAYDINRDLVWCQTATNASPLFSYDPANPTTYTLVKSNSGFDAGGYMSAVFNPNWDRYLVLGENKGIYSYDPEADSWSHSDGSGETAILGTAFRARGCAYDPVTHKIVMWGGGNDVYFMDSDFSITKQSYEAGPVALAAGTYGRFRYSSLIDGFVAYNSVNANTYELRTR